MVIPAYNEERRLPQSLERIVGYLEEQPYAWEIWVADDGSTDHTGEVVREFSKRHPQVHLLSLHHRGKGHAVKAGMLAAQGQYRFQCDADLSMPIRELPKFLPPQLDGFDIAVGSREIPGAQRLDEPSYRHYLGRVYNYIVRAVAVRGIRDTQCGFKCFRAQVAEEVFPCQRIDGWGFDVETLFIAQQRGFRLVEVPIEWHHVKGKTRNALAMFFEALAVRRNSIMGRYR
ncbi:MAG: glycosyltransferase family 2 protein [Chloroflexi bacterium]|nr:glycosyltransferase family 2 protein [Chloroflexota bacterium]